MLLFFLQSFNCAEIIGKASGSARSIYCVIPPTHHTQSSSVEVNGNLYFRYLYCEVSKSYTEALNKAQQPPQCDLKTTLRPKLWNHCHAIFRVKFSAPTLALRCCRFIKLAKVALTVSCFTVAHSIRSWEFPRKTCAGDKP